MRAPTRDHDESRDKTIESEPLATAEPESRLPTSSADTRATESTQSGHIPTAPASPPQHRERPKTTDELRLNKRFREDVHGDGASVEDDVPKHEADRAAPTALEPYDNTRSAGDDSLRLNDSTLIECVE